MSRRERDRPDPSEGGWLGQCKCEVRVMISGGYSSQSQASSSSTSRLGLLGVAPRGSATAIAGSESNALRFYTDGALRLKISPTVVLVMSLYFIGFVIALHVFGKLYNYRFGP
ncbi:hypothetical protein U1Q18_026624 [Sarracenia purpurea var. burkii]